MQLSQNKIAVIGMGYVGAAMATVIANAKRNKKKSYKVLGIEANNVVGKKISKLINLGKLPFEINDKSFIKSLSNSVKIKKNLTCSTEIKNIEDAEIVIVSINCDLKKNKNKDVDLESFIKSIKKILLHINEKALLIIESTIPPGTCEKKIIPLMRKIFKKRNLNIKNLLLAYTYERVMPGANYLNSIKNYWRVFSGYNDKSKKKCEVFLKNIINTKQYPLTKLDTISSCELGKILENSFRATNIAFIEEWARFAEKMKIDLYKVIESIRLRPTHNNIRHPGFGVGGYCLTKDPFFGEYAAKKLWGFNDLQFPFSKSSVQINNKMPLVTLKKIKKLYNNNIKNKKILILGMSYKENVGDLRFSPSIFFSKYLLNNKAKVFWHDPHVKSVNNPKLIKVISLKKLFKYDLILFSVSHNLYKKLKFKKKNFKKTYIFDSNYVLTNNQINQVIKEKINFGSIGR